MPKLIRGEKWFPQTDPRISPREILSVFAGVRYRTFGDGRGLPLVRGCSHRAFADWIRKWKCKL